MLRFSTKMSSKLIIFPLISLLFLSMPKMSTSIKCCKTKTCNSNSSSIDNIFPIESPFHVIDRQSEPCGCPEFGLFCDDKLGLLLELPDAGNFTVKTIYYNFKGILVSDPNDCLPQKLLSLNLKTNSSFQDYSGQSTEYYLIYNCSGVGQDLGFSYDDIDCLKGSNYSIVSVMPNTTVTTSNCTLLKKVSVVTIKADSHNHLSKYSSLLLSWDPQDCESCDNSSFRSRVAVSFTIVIILVIVVSLAMWAFSLFSRSNDTNNVTTTDTNHVVTSHSPSPPSSGAQGLDETTINSYPTMVIGKSSRLIKPDDSKCPICLSDYLSGDTLKILPECMHRYHAACIDLWLSIDVTCPICRTSPPHNS